MFLRPMFVAAVTIALTAPLTVLAADVPAPLASVTSINDLTVPETPYDRAQDADRAVSAALARAARDKKLVLIDLGANWCADCRILSGVMALPKVDAFMQAHYETVLVDVGRINRNLQIPGRFGITDLSEGVPAVLIVTPEGTLTNRGHTEALAEARKMTPQGIADWLASWAR